MSFTVVPSTKKNSVVLGDKNNYYIENLNMLKDISPNSKFLIILRDPRDVYCSYKGIAELKSESSYIPQLADNSDSFTNDWIDNQFKILQFLKKINQKQFTVINYEDLIIDSRTELSKVGNFLKLPFEEQILFYYKTNDEPKALLDWKKKTLQPPDSSSIGRYKKLLSLNEIQIIESKTFELYEQLKRDVFNV